jgi:hypothetical protein
MGPGWRWLMTRVVTPGRILSHGRITQTPTRSPYWRAPVSKSLSDPQHSADQSGRVGRNS